MKKQFDAEFEIERRKCYFCKCFGIVGFNEHYYFCPDCSAIYTFCIIHKTKCKHIDKRKQIPIAEREPWFIDIREKSIYILERNNKQICSVCKKSVLSDGW